MKKFKVVEEGRILTNQELAQVQGGSNICISQSIYRICSGTDGSKVVCNGVTIKPCITNLATCDGTLKLCNTGVKSVCRGDMSIIVNN